MRTFVALELPAPHKQAILEYLNVWSKIHKAGIRWVEPDNLHLTLLFIGDVHGGDLPALKNAIFELAVKSVSFDLSCLGFELFPAKDPKLLWVKLSSADESIFAFAKNLNRVVRNLGYEPDAKSLKLHITLARIKAPQQAWLEQVFLQSELPKCPASYSSITLYQSILKNDGPVYIPLQQYEIFRTNK